MDLPATASADRASSDADVESALTPSIFKSPPEIAALSIFAVLSLYCAWLSDGFVAADACTHYLFAKYAFSDPVNFVDVWGRPLCTLIDAVPAQLGLFAVRTTHVAIAITCALVARTLAHNQSLPRPGLALLFTIGAPLFFLFSFSEMTELPFALVLGLAFLCYQREKWVLFALLAGLLPTARPEGFAFILLAAIALLFHRRWLALLPLITPLLIWDVAGWLLTDRPVPLYAWLVHAWPWSEQGLYGRGSIFTFVGVLPVIVPPLVLPATLVGMWVTLFQHPSRPTRHARISRLLVAAIPLSILIGHSVLRWLGKFGTFGEARYLLICAPFWGVLSAAGFEWISQRLSFRHPWRIATVALLIPALLNVASPAVPLHLPPDWQTARRFADLYRANHLKDTYPRVIAAHPAVPYFLGADPNGNARQDAFTGAAIKHPPPGALLVWDPIYCTTNAIAEDAAAPDQLRTAGWTEDHQLTGELNERALSKPWIVFQSPAANANP